MPTTPTPPPPAPPTSLGEVLAGAAPPRTGLAAILARAAPPPHQPAAVRVTGVLVLGGVIDLILGLIKWPVALLALALLVPTAQAFGDVARQIGAQPDRLWFFLAGAGGYVLVVKILLRRTWFGTYFSTLEHELTHALFGLATIHKVGNFRVTRNDGGHVEILGGNWLISIAPYFFPTLSVALIAIAAWLPAAALRWVDVALGASVGYHLVSTLRETHPAQPDLRYTGRIFALAFLPAANLFVYGVLLSYALGDGGGLTAHVDSVVAHARALYHR